MIFIYLLLTAFMPDNPIASTLLFPPGRSLTGFLPFVVSSIFPANPLLKLFYIIYIYYP